MGSKSSKITEDAQKVDKDSMGANSSRRKGRMTLLHPNQKPVKQETPNSSSEQPSHASSLRVDTETHTQKAQSSTYDNKPVVDSLIASRTGAGTSTAATLAPSSTSPVLPPTPTAAPTIPDTPVVDSLISRDLDAAPGPQETPRGNISLWDSARAQYQEKTQKDLNLGEECDINLIESFIQDIQKRKEKCDEKRWSYKTKSGQTVFYLDSVIEQLNKYALIGDLAIQHHPDIVALAWAGFRFILQVGTAYTDNMKSIADGLSGLIRILCCCDIYERLYISMNLQINKQLADSIVNLYVSILEYLTYAGEHLQKNTPKKIWDGFLNGAAEKLETIANMEKMVIANSEVAEKEAAHAGRLDQTETSQNLKCLLFGMESIFSLVQKDRYLKILTWLSGMPFASHHDYFRKRRRGGTGGWLLEHEKYGKWMMSEKSSIFWLRGGPGCGKSYLASKVIDNVLDEVKMHQHKGHVAAYFYCHYSEEGRNDPASILRAIIKQLCLSMGGVLVPTEVLSVYMEREEQGHSSGPPDVEECRDLIIKLCDGYTKTTIMIDALDECNEKERRALFYALGEIVKRTQFVKVFVTGRDIQDIRETLFDHSNHYIEESDNKADIDLYIQSEIERRSQLHCVDKQLLKGIGVTPEFKDFVISRLQEKANGMFMWAQFQIIAICEERTADKVRAALDTLPESLDKTYDRILSKIDEHHGSDRSIAKRVLSWIFFAEAPCSPETIIQSLAVEPGESSPNMGQLGLRLQDVLDVCQNLVVYDEKLDTLRFAHFSVQEYLQRHPEFVPHLGHGRMAEICMRSFIYDHTDVDRLYLLWELREYSASNWITHVRLSGARSLETCIVFMNSSTAFNRWVGLALQKGVFEKGISTGFTPLWAACYYRLQNVVEKILSRDISQINSTNPCGVHGETPLLCATLLKNESIVRALLTVKGVDLNKVDSRGDTPLSVAVEKGYAQIVRMLLEVQGMDMKKAEYKYKTLLWKALGCGNEEVIQMLLNVGSSGMGEDSKYHTPLNKTAIRHYGEIIKALFSREGANVDETGGGGDTPLTKAATHGSVWVVQILLAAGADVNKAGSSGRSPLFISSEIGHAGVVQILLAVGADVNKADSSGRSPLLVSSENGHAEVVQILLALGADVNKADSSGRLPLLASSENGHAEVVRILLAAKEVGVNRPDRHGRSPLLASSENGHVEVVRILSTAKGVSLNKADHSGRSPLLISSWNGHAGVVQILLAAGADVNKVDSLGRSPLLASSESGHLEVVRILSAAKGVAVNRVDSGGRSPLLVSSENGHAAVVQILLAAGADVNKAGSSGRSPLLASSENGQAGVVRILSVAEGVDMNMIDDSGRSALLISSKNGHAEIVQILLAAGADVNKAGSSGRSPLLASSENGQAGVVRILSAAEGVDMNMVDDSGRSALFISASRGDVEITRALLAVDGVDVNMTDYYGNTPLSVSSVNGHVEVVRVLLAAKGVDVNKPNNSGRSPLLFSVGEGHTEVVQALLTAEGVEVNTAASSGDTALARAVYRGDKELTRMILSVGGVDVNQADSGDGTPLLVASRAGNKDIVCMLLAAEGIDINRIAGDHFYTPLAYVVRHENIEILQVLSTAEDVDINKALPGYDTPLTLATRYKSKEILTILLAAKGIDVNRAAGEHDRTPLAYAVQVKRTDTVRFLLTVDGVDVNKADNEGNTPLLLATKNCDEEMVRILLAVEGVDLNKLDNNGHTALGVAFQNRWRDIISLLRKAMR